MQKLLKLSFALVAIFMAFSAKAITPEQLEGKWEEKASESGLNAVTIYDFKADGTIFQIFTLTSESPKMNIIGQGAGKYTLKDDVITFTFSATDFEFPSFYVEGIPDSMIEMAKTQMQQQYANAQQQFKDVKIEGNTLTGNFEGKEFTFTRVD